MQRGFSLLELAVALGIVSSILVVTIASLSDMVLLRRDGVKKSRAMYVAQEQLAALYSSPNGLQIASNNGTYLDENSGDEYDWETFVTQEIIDILSLSQGLGLGGEEGGAPDISDQLPANVRNPSDNPDTQQSGFDTSILGEVRILRIVISVYYPKGRGVKGKYQIQSFELQ